ncbi:hypothetical protein [Spiroplasma floricola]|uniref:Uncharacterized protein n=1 Tax=Spiroplasma floricola 23-6 TaxID=1336749 RepID=A0A2K8SDB0_9MOLU|nr:hypothetical protein [Spiroplasma floricola]AUB31457.1 hypothetical protein SFLOR_v1c04050 [Spiroplasma floricola 23-6]
MKLNKDIWKFNITVKKLTSENKEIFKKINFYFNELKTLFSENRIYLKKVGDFSYNSYKETHNNFNLEICAIKFITKSTFDFNKFNNLILEISKKYKEIPEIHINKNYLNLIFNFRNKTINFRIIPISAKKTKEKLICKVNRNGRIQEDLILNLTSDFKNANKLSSGLLISLKRIINYIMNGEFNYSYDIDYLLLRWFYEYISKTLEKFILKKYNEKEIDLNIEQFMKTENFRKWIKKNVSFLDLTNFIFLKLESKNTYYFSEFDFKYEEIFEGISRYSINTNSNFKLPVNYLSEIKLFDTNLLDHKTYIQNNLSNENGLSLVSWEKFKNERQRYIISPVIKTGISNWPMFQKWLTVKSNELYVKLNSDLKSEIKTTKQREAMSELNQIANEWLTKYSLKLKYLQPYFDKKYPFVSNYKIEELVLLIIQTIDKIDSKQWIIKNDN